MEMISIDLIKVDNDYLRINSDVESLMKSIETVGVIAPLVVNEDNRLLAGGRRYTALKQLGWTEVPVNRIENRKALEQELISIDENLVRKSLSKLEFEKCLARGREIYEELHPEAPKVDLEPKDLSPAEKKIAKEEEERDVSSFAAVTAAKTGLSKGAIKKAIQRDVLSSEKVKEAREEGVLSASQTNEIMKLKASEQDKILPYVAQRSGKAVKKIIDDVKENGVDAAIENTLAYEEPPKEFLQIQVMAKKTAKLLGRVNAEELFYDGTEMEKILRDVFKMRDNLEEFIRLQTGGDVTMGYVPTKDEEEAQDLHQ